MPVTSWGSPLPPEPPPEGDERAVAPVRWPHPGWPTLAMIGVWVLGGLLAVFVPALIVAPTEQNPDGARVLLAFSCTVAGALVMAAVGWVLHRWHGEPLAWSFGVVPAIAVFIGGIVMAGAKYYG